jgi:hypothetical protein
VVSPCVAIKDGKTCHQTDNHEWHLAGYGDQRALWLNEDFRPPTVRSKVAESVLGDLARRTHEGRRSSGLSDDR